jgi:hypothetical protein
VRHETLVTVDREAPVKLVRVRLTHLGGEPRALALVWQARLVLGSEDSVARRTLTSARRVEWRAARAQSRRGRLVGGRRVLARGDQ